MNGEKVTEICTKLVEMFKSGQFPKAVARTLIMRQSGDETPCSKWSINNQLLMLAAGTADARGFNQWKAVKRYVRKGAKAFYILAPLVKTAQSNDGSTDEARIIGFHAVPVFKVEDTEGEPLQAFDCTPPVLPPLHELGERLGSVSYAPAADNSVLGSCTLKGNIRLYSCDPDVYFHELAHQVHNTIAPLKPGQQADQEIVAEMVACVLCEMYGYSGYHWSGWDYIQAYAGGNAETAIRAVGAVMHDVEAVLISILAYAQNDSHPTSIAAS